MTEDDKKNMHGKLLKQWMALMLTCIARMLAARGLFGINMAIQTVSMVGRSIISVRKIYYHR